MTGEMTGGKIKMYKFTVSNGQETYSWEEDEECWEGSNIPTGEWRAPFPNERGNSMAFGLVENFEQSSRGRAGIVRNINYVKIERIPPKADNLEDKVKNGVKK